MSFRVQSSSKRGDTLRVSPLLLVRPTGFEPAFSPAGSVGVKRSPPETNSLQSRRYQVIKEETPIYCGFQVHRTKLPPFFVCTGPANIVLLTELEENFIEPFFLWVMAAIPGGIEKDVAVGLHWFTYFWGDSRSYWTIVSPVYQIALFLLKQRVLRLAHGIVFTGFGKESPTDIRLLPRALRQKNIYRHLFHIIQKKIVRLNGRESICSLVIAENDLVAVQKLLQMGKRSQPLLHLAEVGTVLYLFERILAIENISENSGPLFGLKANIIF